jgi:multidrug transporter EmrE-like cation transporter
MPDVSGTRQEPSKPPRWSMSPESGYRFRDKDMRVIKKLKRKERIRKIATRFSHLSGKPRRNWFQGPCPRISDPARNWFRSDQSAPLDATHRRGECAPAFFVSAVSISALLHLLIATVAFVGAGTAAKWWALSDKSPWLLILTLSLYTIGNLILLPLVRSMGMGIALSLSAVTQLLAVNLIALTVFGERVTAMQAVGLGLAVLSIGLITYTK